MIAHDYLIQTQILDNAQNRLFSQSNVTASDLLLHSLWTPVKKGNYTIDAIAWLRLAENESMAKLLETSKTIVVQDQSSFSLSEGTFAAMGVGLGLAAVIALLIFVKRRQSKRSLHLS